MLSETVYRVTSVAMKTTEPKAFLSSGMRLELEFCYLLNHVGLVTSLFKAFLGLVCVRIMHRIVLGNISDGFHLCKEE